jgi:hypothetical protein
MNTRQNLTGLLSQMKYKKEYKNDESENILVIQFGKSVKFRVN